MKVKNHIKKFLIISLWMVIGTGVMVLLIAAIKLKRERLCTGYSITINGEKDGQRFIDKKNVVQLLTKKGTETFKHKSISEFDLQKMEVRLERHAWVKDAQLFFDNNQVLQVKIKERVPIARVITVLGNSFYIDSSCARLPLSDKISARVPVFTSFPSDKERLMPADKLLIKEIKKISAYILKDPFWMAQVSQVDITSARIFEIIPTMGNHIIEFGNANNCEQKFKNLFLFYRQVLSKTGMEKYAKLNVRYEKQVIGIRKSYVNKTDSIKFVKSIEELISASGKIDSSSSQRDEVIKTN